MNSAKHAFVTLASENGHLVHANVLFESLRRVNTTAELVLLTFDNFTISPERIPPDVVIINSTHPVPFSAYPATYLDTLHHKPNKPFRGPWDMVKLHVWQLTQYERVAFLDADMLALQNIDALFALPGCIAFSDGPCSPFNSGMFVASPNLTTYRELVHILCTANHTKEGGWHGTGGRVPALYANPKSGRQAGSGTTQGLLYYYFKLLDPPKDTTVLPRGIWNWQVPEDSSDLTSVRLAHFTGCGKPPRQPDDTKPPVCHELHKRWSDLRSDMVRRGPPGLTLR